jgi:hypothetical protein
MFDYHKLQLKLKCINTNLDKAKSINMDRSSTNVLMLHTIILASS